MNQKFSKLNTLLILGLAIFANACSFRFPSYAEQQYLLSHDAFPSGAPPWMAAPLAASKAGGGGALSGSLIPQTYGDNVGELSNVAFTNAERGAVVSRGQVSQREMVEDERRRVAEEQWNSSPLNRISSLCPSIESDVNDALQTVDIRARTSKYEVLSKRCPASADIWLWLARDYRKSGRLAEASRSYEKVLTIDHANKEASDSLLDVRQELQRSKAKEK